MEIVTKLIDSYGYATYGGNSHVFADADEGWVLLEFAGGKGLWVARRLGPDDIWLNWRGYHGFGYVQELPADWRENARLPRFCELRVLRRRTGLVQPALGSTLQDHRHLCAARPVPGLHGPRSACKSMPACVPRLRAWPSEHLMKVLRSTGRDSSGYGQVAHLRGGVPPDLRTLWVAPGPPVTAPFVPWRIGVESVPPEFRRHRYLTAGEAERTVDPVQRGLESTRYANRAVKRLLYLVDEHREVFLPEVVALLEAHDRSGAGGAARRGADRDDPAGGRGERIGSSLPDRAITRGSCRRPAPARRTRVDPRTADSAAVRDPSAGIHAVP